MPFLISRQKSRLIIIASAVLFFFAGCGDRQDGIAGQWRPTGDTNAMVWDFSKDGSVLMGRTRGRYSFGSQKRLKIETPTATFVYQMELSGERLILREANGARLELTKAR